ncbi:MAG: DUF1648 domain-containing protein [Blautia sp.]
MKIKLPVTLYQRILSILSFLLLAGQILCLILRWNHLPDEIPTHFGLSGQADAYGTKGERTVTACHRYSDLSLILFVEKFPNSGMSPTRDT